MKQLENKFIPYELSLKLKELGFNKQCLGYYFDNKKFQIIKEYEVGVFDRNSTTNRYDGYGERPTAILWQDAFEWFRDNHNLDGNIKPINAEWGYEINNLNMCYCISVEIGFISHKESQLECLKKLISIVEKR